MENRELINILIDFISSIGIKVIKKEIDEDTFLPGILIDKGSLIIDEQKLLYPGDLLHEAGHIATLTSQKREVAYNDISKNPGDEIATLAWSYAALKYLGVDASLIFHSNGYKGDSIWLIEHFESEGDMGVPLLEWMGLTYSKKSANEFDKKSFPIMQKWIRE